MSYPNVPNSVSAQATAVTGFSSANVSRQNFNILHTGQGSACVIAYDSFQQTIAEMGGEHHIQWRFLLGLYSRASGLDAAAVSANLATVRQGFIDRFNSYPKLGGTASIFHSIVEAGQGGPQGPGLGGGG